MPLPLIIGGIAAIAGAAGVGSGIHGGFKMKSASDTMKLAKLTQESAIKEFEMRNDQTTKIMDILGNQELHILQSFNEFSSIIEKIQGRPEFKEYSINGVNLPEYTAEELKKISAGAGLLIGGMGGAAAGTAGGFAAAGVTTSAVMALGTASTGTAISTLSGVAATNATIAAIGGGSIATGGGGMALGATILGGATLGIGLLVGGVIFNITGSKLSDKADEAYLQAKRTEEEVGKITTYFNELAEVASNYNESLTNVEAQYRKRLTVLDHIVNTSNKTMWSEFSEIEKKVTENMVLLVGLLYAMCQVKLVLKSDDEDGINTVNSSEIYETTAKAKELLDNMKDAA